MDSHSTPDIKSALIYHTAVDIIAFWREPYHRVAAIPLQVERLCVVHFLFDAVYPLVILADVKHSYEHCHVKAELSTVYGMALYSWCDNAF